jgi:hypothetical protein
MDSAKQISTAVVATLKASDIGGLAKDYAEIGIDSFLAEGILKEIPVIGTLYAIARAGLSVSDQLFAKKLLRFMGSLAELREDERLGLVEKLEEDESYRNKVGHRLIELLDRIDSHAKPEMMARVFKAFAAKKINLDMLNRLNHAIERMPHFDIGHVRAFHDSTPEVRMSIPTPTFTSLTSAGLANPTSGWDALGYEPTEVCKAFISLELDR